MPLSPPVERKLHHTRKISLQAFERTDGLWDVEGHMTDRKAYAVDLPSGKHLALGDPMHDMWLRLTLDETLTIHAIESQMDAAPKPICPNAQPDMQVLVGLRIKSGWMDDVKARIGGALGCTHLRELLPPMATAAIQGIRPAQRMRGVTQGIGRPPRGSCWGWSEDEDREALRGRQVDAGLPARSG